MKRLIKKVTVWATAATLALGMAVLPSSAASKNAPRIDDVDYAGKSKVKVEFAQKVKYKKAKVQVKDNKGKKYKTSILKKNSKALKFKIRKAKKNRTYTFKVKGVKNVGSSRFKTVKGNVTVPKAGVSRTDRIGEDRAKEIALADAGVSASDAKMLSIEFDYDDGRAVYEVEFIAKNKKYEYDIDAVTGDNLKKDVERKNRDNRGSSNGNTNDKNRYDDDYDDDDYDDDDYDDRYDDDRYDDDRYDDDYPVNEESVKYIGSEKAGKIALEDAGLTGKNVNMKGIKFDYEDGKAVYEVEFKYNGMEYEYEIDAVNGDILKKDVEYDD